MSRAIEGPIGYSESQCGSGPEVRLADREVLAAILERLAAYSAQHGVMRYGCRVTETSNEILYRSAIDGSFWVVSSKYSNMKEEVNTQWPIS